MKYVLSILAVSVVGSDMELANQIVQKGSASPQMFLDRKFACDGMGRRCGLVHTDFVRDASARAGKLPPCKWPLDRNCCPLHSLRLRQDKADGRQAAQVNA